MSQLTDAAANDTCDIIHCRFTPAQLLESLKAKGYKLGLVIDLTYTSRYYNGRVSSVTIPLTMHYICVQVLEGAGVLYHKIYCPGHQIPPEEVYTE